MTFLDAIGFGILLVGGVTVAMVYFHYAFLWATDPHNYASPLMRARKYFGWGLMGIGVILGTAVLIYTYPIGG